MSNPRPIIGHIRFSFYGITDTKLRPDRANAALARLYDETRIARRFFLFERLTLPSLLAQTDQDFRVVIMSSDVMPDQYKDRLLQLAERLPDAIVDFSPNRRSLFAYKKHMLGLLGPGLAGSAVHFRLDDDDALAASFISRLRRLSRDLPASTHFSFPKGIMLFPASPGGTEGTSLIRTEPLTAIGLAYVSDASFTRNPFSMAHRQVWRDWPVLSDPTFPAYIRTLHFNNDTAARHDLILHGSRKARLGDDGPALQAKVAEALADEFPYLDLATLDGTLQAVAGVNGMADLRPL
jgi:Putative rhamnosyl transferase